MDIDRWLLGEYGRGSLGARGMSDETADVVAAVLDNENNYVRPHEGPVICMDGRFPGGGLAGGAITLALQDNYLWGGRRLSYNLQSLLRSGRQLWMHRGCAAVSSATEVVKRDLCNVESPAFVLAGIRDPQTYDLPQLRNVADWARSLPSGYFDIEAAMEMLSEHPQGTVAEPHGEHDPRCAIINWRPWMDFVGYDAYTQETGLLGPIVIDAWMSDAMARELGRNCNDIEVKTAALLGRAFTMGVLARASSWEMNLFYVS